MSMFHFFDEVLKPVQRIAQAAERQVEAQTIATVTDISQRYADELLRRVTAKQQSASFGLFGALDTPPDDGTTP